MVDKLPNEVNIAISFAREDAQRMRDNAGFSGSMGDNGAGALDGKISAYLEGWNQQIPVFLNPYIQQAKMKILQMQHPGDYAKFLELKKKFEPND